jgi:hypothetical protein
MLLSLFVALLQTTAPAPRDARPVRVWLGQGSLLARGTPVQVYVQASQDGNLIVLHRRTDGRIEVLFPASPKDDPYVRAGTYEIQATRDRVAFVVAEPDGSGMVLAALAPTGYRFDEFARAAAWNPDALAPSWSGSDGEGALSDIVQRMLGDGYFNYDIATYTVAPPAYAMAQDTGVTSPPAPYPTCTDCTFIGYQENVYEPLALCDPFFSPCFSGRGFRHHGRAGGGAGAAPASTTIALSMRGSASTAVIPRNGRTAGRFVRKGAASIPPIEPRARAGGVPIRAIPLAPGRPAVARAAAQPAVPTRRRFVGAPTEPAPTQVVRLTLTPTAVRDEPEEAPSRTGTIALTGLTVMPPLASAPARVERAARLAPVPRDGAPIAPSQPVAPEAGPRTRSVAIAAAGGRAATGAEVGVAAPPGRMQGVALPRAAFRGAQARIPAASTGSRRR